MKILFRADSSSKIGLGHIMRDLVLAKQFKDDEILFACQDLEGNIMDKIPYPKIVLNSNSIDELIMIIKKENIDLLVIDHYGICFKEEKEIKQKTGVKIFVLDDTYEKHYCDILLNHNLGADKKRYKGLVPESCELRCGSRYTLIRDEFIIEKRKKRVFVAMGGADHSNINIKILKLFKKFKNIKVHLVTTLANNNLIELKKYTKDKKWIKLHIDSTKIAKLMKKSDFAIVTPSVVLNEVVFMNLPFIAIKTAENQNYIYEYLKEQNYPVLKRFDSKRFLKMVKSFIQPELINFTNLSKKETEMVLKWRNDKNIRKWMFTQDIIKKKDHISYIKLLKSNKNKSYFLVKYESKYIGVINFTWIDTKNKKITIGLYSNPDLKGFGKLLMSEILIYAQQVLKAKTVVVEVLKDNKSAVKLYKSYYFSLISQNKNILTMELKL